MLRGSDEEEVLVLVQFLFALFEQPRHTLIAWLMDVQSVTVERKAQVVGYVKSCVVSKAELRSNHGKGELRIKPHLAKLLVLLFPEGIDDEIVVVLVLCRAVEQIGKSALGTSEN
jgi:hypothetical protein